MKKLGLTFIISRDGKELVRFEHQENDAIPLGWLLSHQGHSIRWAILYEGYKVEEINETTGHSHFWIY